MKRTRTLSTQSQERQATRPHIEAEDRVDTTSVGEDQNEGVSLSLLENRVVHGDTDAMLLLAERYTYEDAKNYNPKYAEALIMKAAEMGNKKAKALKRFITKYKEQERVNISRLSIDTTEHLMITVAL